MKIIFLNILERLGWAFIIWTIMSSEPIEIIRFGITDNINYLYDISSSNIIKIEGIFNSFRNVIASEVISFFDKV